MDEMILSLEQVKKNTNSLRNNDIERNLNLKRGYRPRMFFSSLNTVGNFQSKKGTGSGCDL